MNAHTPPRFSARRSSIRPLISKQRLSTLRLLALHLSITLLGSMLLTTGLLA